MPGSAGNGRAVQETRGRRDGLLPARVAALAAVYLAAAALGLSLAGTHGNVSLVWPPAGIAIAALVLGGSRLWPGVALGAFVANALTGVSLGTAAGIAAGNTLEAVLGVWLLRRAGFRPALDRVADVLALLGLAAAVSTTASATIGVASLCAGGSAEWTAYGTLWWQWWLGDAMGVLVIAPALLVLSSPTRTTPAPVRIVEAATLGISLAAVAEAVFGGWLPRGGPGDPLVYAVFPWFLWAALRFEQRGAATATLLVSAIAIWETTRGPGPFAARTLTESLMRLQIFMSVVAVTALVLAAAMGQRRRFEAAGREAEALRYVTSLAAAAAHEINNPLTAVVGNLELIVAEAADATTRERARLGLAGADRIHDIVLRMGRIARLRLVEQSSALPEMLDLQRSSGEEEN